MSMISSSFPEVPGRLSNSPAPDRSVAPVYIPAGFYLLPSDYARMVGVTRITVRNRLNRGDVDGIQVGKNMRLVRVGSERVVEEPVVEVCTHGGSFTPEPDGSALR